MEEKIKAILMAGADELFGQSIDSNMIQFQLTRKEFEGDLTLVVFPFAKILKVTPLLAAQKIGEYLLVALNNEVEGYSVVQGFLNIAFKDAYWLSKLMQIDADDEFGLSYKDSKDTVLVEYSSPNTNKPLHLGHLRNNFLGYSVAEILKANGNKVIKSQIINDRGIHICKSMLAWDRFSPLNARGEKETPANTGLKGDKLVGRYYVIFDQKLNAEANEILKTWEKNEFSDFDQALIDVVKGLLEAKKDKEGKSIDGIDAKLKELAKNETSLLRDAKEMLIKWEGRDPQVYLLWTTMNGWVYEGFKSTYEKMGVDFDRLYYESETFLLGKEIVQLGLESGVFFKKEDGSVWIDLTEDGLDQKLLLRSDGTAVYITQDLGTAVDRKNDFPFLNGMVYTVGNEQDYHFQVLFLILKKMGYEWSSNCHHLSYGMVDLPSGKMKSREGTVVDADDLMDEVILKAKEMTSERGQIEGLTEAEKELLYYQIGMGGLKYYLLKVDPKKRMLFNPEESIELNGNTGPFLQYTHARIHSLLAKGGGIGDFNNALIGVHEKQLIKILSQFPEVIQAAAKSYSPALIANYTYELVKEYNSFYQSCFIVIEQNQEIKSLRLCISKNTAKLIKIGLRMLGIEAPIKM